VSGSVRTKSKSLIPVREPKARVLSVSASDADHAALYDMIDTRRWQFATADSCRQAVRELRSNGARAVFCERALPDGEWKDILEQISGLDSPPRFAVVARLADENLWFEVFERGGYDVLSKPLIEEEVRNVLGSAAPHPVPPIRTNRLFVVRNR
jgi:DNA-binding NtrC family response regulator